MTKTRLRKLGEGPWAEFEHEPGECIFCTLANGGLKAVGDVIYFETDAGAVQRTECIGFASNGAPAFFCFESSREEAEQEIAAHATRDHRAKEAHLKAIDLVLHDWRNLSAEERETALSDVRALATTFGAAAPSGAGRRARALNIVASYFHFLEPAPAPAPSKESAPATPQILFPGDAIPSGGTVYGFRVGPTQPQRARFERLLASLDELVAVWIYVTGKAPSEGTIFELMQWTSEQRSNPTDVER